MDRQRPGFGPPPRPATQSHGTLKAPTDGATDGAVYGGKAAAAASAQQQLPVQNALGQRSQPLRLAGHAVPEPASSTLEAKRTDPVPPLKLDRNEAIAATLDPETRIVFEEALATLAALKAGRAQVEEKLRELGREDPIRTVTGTSALDAAIERTEAILRTLGSMRSLGDDADRV
jgi:hypothetical protein